MYRSLASTALGSLPRPVDRLRLPRARRRAFPFTSISFTGVKDLTVVISGGTDYAPDAAADYRDPSLDPQALAKTKVLAAARHSASTLLHTHVADFLTLSGQLAVNLGASSAAQRELDTWDRVQARWRDNVPDPELEAAYLQFGRYLMISGSRGSLLMGL